MEEVVPEVLFLAYAWGCADSRRQRGLISEADYETLERCNTEGVIAPVEMLLRCFPDACRALYAHSGAKSRDPWSYLAVSRFWREFHLGMTPVWKATVERVVKHASICAVRVCRLGDYPQLVLNPRKLILEEGDIVYVHGFCIAERVPKLPE